MRGILVISAVMVSLAAAVSAAMPGSDKTASHSDAAAMPIVGCPSVIQTDVAKVELVAVESIPTPDKSSYRTGIFRVTNSGPKSIALGGTLEKGQFHIDFPDAWEAIQVGAGSWEGSNGIAGAFMEPPDKLTIPSHAAREFVTDIEPNLPIGWGSQSKFHIVVHTLGWKACLVSEDFSLTPRAVLERMALDAAGKLNADVCPSKVFDRDVVVRFVKKQKFDFGPYADSGPEDLGIMEIENHRLMPIILHGERHGNYFYIPESRVLVQQHLKGGIWKTNDPFIPATVRYPLDILEVPAGGKATFVAQVDPGALYDGWDRTDRAILVDAQAKICAASQRIYDAPDRNCKCSDKASP